jgi:hypothetical protein
MGGMNRQRKPNKKRKEKADRRTRAYEGERNKRKKNVTARIEGKKGTYSE